MSCLDRDEPISYMVLCGLLVRVNVILASTWKGVEVRSATLRYFILHDINPYASPSLLSVSLFFPVHVMCLACSEQPHRALIFHISSLSSLVSGHTQWSAWMASLGPKVFETPKLWIDLITLFAWNCSYAALYDLCYTLDNPFGPRRIDVAHETIGAGIRRLVTRVMDGHLEPPPPVAVGEPRKKDF